MEAVGGRYVYVVMYPERIASAQNWRRLSKTLSRCLTPFPQPNLEKRTTGESQAARPLQHKPTFPIYGSLGHYLPFHSPNPPPLFPSNLPSDILSSASPRFYKASKILNNTPCTDTTPLPPGLYDILVRLRRRAPHHVNCPRLTPYPPTQPCL